MLYEIIAAIIIAAFIIAFLIYNWHNSNIVSYSVTNTDLVKLRIGRDHKHLTHLAEHCEIHVLLEDFNVISLELQEGLWCDELQLQWFSSFLEDDYIYRLPNAVNIFERKGTINIRMRTFDEPSRRDRKYEHIFLSISNGDKYIAQYKIIVWYDNHEHLHLLTTA